MKLVCCRRTLAILLALNVVALTTHSLSLAGSGAVLRGRVLGTDGSTPRSGALVHLVEPSSERIVGSATTDERGTFRIESAPAATYTVVIETPEGAFLAARALDVKSGANAPLALTLRRDVSEPATQGEPPKPASTPAAPPPKKPGYMKWVIVGGVTVGALLVLDAVTSEEESSPF